MLRARLHPPMIALQLAAQAQVTFAAPPAKQSTPEGRYGGLATMTLTQPWLYRISLDKPFWVDVRRR